jgi:hypothetical protein
LAQAAAPLLERQALREVAVIQQHVLAEGTVSGRLVPDVDSRNPKQRRRLEIDVRQRTIINRGVRKIGEPVLRRGTLGSGLSPSGKPESE